MKNWFLLILLSITILACKEEVVEEEPWGTGICEFDGLDVSNQACFDEKSPNTLDVATWNLKNFPLFGGTTQDLVAEILINMDADVIALQEIGSSTTLRQLTSRMPGWHYEYVNLSGDLDLAFLFKKCEINSISDPLIVADQVWPRPAAEVTIDHISGISVTLINIHLKCCGGQDNIDARASASALLKDHIDTDHPNDPVILLGDFNDEIEATGPFSNFIDDSENYVFADQAIAEGPDSDWSYPSFPSHIDHIMITDELFSKVVTTKTVKPEDCVEFYSDYVSDHRPVLIRLEQ